MRTDDQNVPLPLRSYTLLGVCEAIGEDFGFNANYLRVPLGAVVVLNIWAAVGAYLALGLVVLASRLLFPRKKAEQPAVQTRLEPANRDYEEKIAA
jgi:phage shock protein C